jgi:hypothetical protein
VKKELRDAWCKALRSDEYGQAHEELRHPNLLRKVMCCLGVLCDIVDPAGWNGNGHKLSNLEVLTDDACESLGIPKAIMNALASANDGSNPSNSCAGLDFTKKATEESDWGLRPASFEEIADIIEKKVPLD